MNAHQEHPTIIKRILYFFPIQLLLLHFKRNHFIVLLWIILFAYVGGFLGTKYGIPYLFLAPEYLGEIDVLSFGIMGFALGGFITAFNIYSYVMNAYRFKFIATLARPFFKFSLNNSLIPLIFVLYYIYRSSWFLSVNELQTSGQIALEMLSFVFGCTLFLILSYLYFFRTNTDLKKLNQQLESEVKTSPLHNKKRWYDAFFQKEDWHVHAYLSGFWQINLARDVTHYSNELLFQVLSQNRINAARFELLSLLSFLILGTFKEYDMILIPAAASTLLLGTILLMFISILYSWLKTWAVSVVFVSIILVNAVTNEYDFLRFKNYAYGLDYDKIPSAYLPHELSPNFSRLERDIEAEIEALNQWKQSTGEERPQLIIVNCSGGGLRSSLWTFHTLQTLDRASQGDFFKHTRLITGSSGGMIGASYYRALALKDIQKNDDDRFNQQHGQSLSKDLLNSIAFTIATSDLFPRIQSFEYDGKSYTKDRGFMFEKNLNQNTQQLLNTPLNVYDSYVGSGVLPRSILAPTIVNDGRRLLISSDHLSYMCHNPSSPNFTENIEFRHLFKDQDAEQLRYSSALRMNATFPYVFPMVTLPSEPHIEVMDAGLRDNFGVKDAVKYLSTFESWIKDNTSGVMVVQIRDRSKTFYGEHNGTGTLLRRVFTPFGNVYGNVLRTQDFANDQVFGEFSKRLNHPIEVVQFDLLKEEGQDISMSWHLTALEKKQILESLEINGNKAAFDRILQIIEKPNQQ